MKRPAILHHAATTLPMHGQKSQKKSGGLARLERFLLQELEKRSFPELSPVKTRKGATPTP